MSPTRITGAAGETPAAHRTSTAAATPPFFVLEGVSKRYGGVRALEEAHLACEPGRIHAVLGENGAGKSTLIKVMAGVVQPDSGTISLEGRPVTFPFASTRI